MQLLQARRKNQQGRNGRKKSRAKNRKIYNDPASSCESTSAFFARLRARRQSPAAPASCESARKLLIFETRSVCVTFNVFPDAAERFFAAAPAHWFVCSCKACDSAEESCGTINGASDFAAGTFPGAGGTATCGRTGAPCTTTSRTGCGGNSNLRSGSGSSGATAVVCARRIGRTCTAAAQASAGLLRSAQPPPITTAQHNKMPHAQTHSRLRKIGDWAGFFFMLTL